MAAWRLMTLPLLPAQSTLSEAMSCFQNWREGETKGPLYKLDILDRLFVLLDTGSTPVVRRSAAEQLGQVQKLHPHELHNLLNKLHFYLGSASWESRIAASQAVEAICKHVPQWDPQGLSQQDAVESASSASLAQSHSKLAQFDILKVLANGAALMGSEGTEYATENTGPVDAEQLSRQKQLLNKRLGLDVAGGLGTGELFAEEDLMLTHDNLIHGNVKLVQHLVEKQLSHNLSARERNRAKRKAKLMSRQTSSDPDMYKNNGDSNDSVTNKMRKTTSSVVVDQADTDRVLVDNVPDNTLNMDQLEEWPFESFCEQLLGDLFNPSWEKRHGAATALREIIKIHSKGAGKTADLATNQMAVANQLWLQDAALRLICVMALDRFGDFVSDEVIAPVRETSAQTLGTLLKFMDTSGVEAVVKVLLQLLGQQQWEVRHGSLLGFKYLMAVRQDLSAHLLPAVVPHLLPSLTDTDDDVRAVAASSLLPVTDQLVTVLPQVVHSLVMCLWHTLLDLDDLTASTGSVMKLLSSLLANQALPGHCVNVNDLTTLVPRLYPFLSHNISLVREAALDTMVTLLTRYNTQGNNNWIPAILPTSLRHFFQRALVEEKQTLLEKVYQVWQCFLMNIPPLHIIAATSQWTGVWLSLMMQPSRLPLDNNLLLTASFYAREMTPSRTRHLALHGPREHKEQQHHIGGNGSLSEGSEKRDTAVVRARLAAARLLGHLLANVSVADPCLPVHVERPEVALGKLLVYHLGTKSALQRCAVAMVVEEWVRSQEQCECPDFVRTRLRECLSEPIYYDEIAMAFTRMQSECRDFLTGLKQQGIELDMQSSTASVFTLEQAQSLATSVFDSVKVKLKGKAAQLFEDRRRCLQQTVEQTTLEQQVLSNRVQSSLASAVVALKCLPDKLNPVIRPLMEAAKKEGNAQLQSCAACSLSRLLHLCVSREPCPNGKVAKNLCSLLCSDPLFTPLVAPPPGFKGLGEMAIEAGCKEIKTTKQEGILTLCSQIVMCHMGNSSSGRGRKPTSQKWAVPKSLDVQIDTHIEEPDLERKQILIGRRGATLCLSQIVGDFGKNLEDGLPSLWQTITDFQTNAESDTDAQELVNSLQVLEVTAPALHPDLQTKLTDLLGQLYECLLNPYTAVRHMAARCLATLSKLVTMETIEFILEKVIPLLGATDCDIKRQGAIETLTNVIESLSLEVLPFIVLLIVPVLGRMSDQNHAVRLMATHCFATLIKLLPLESTIPDPPSMKAALSERKEKERKFLEQLLDGSKVEAYKVPIPIKADLRKYQQDGVNWMAFLCKYKLHGILCDDMGLGKTLQALCMLAGDMHARAQAYKNDKAADCAPLPSIVVCPPTLTGHWVYEVDKFIDKKDLNPLHYTGTPGERQRLQKRLKKHNLVVTSYEMVRNDVDFFSRHRWNYCILDEGHIIKNSKTKISRCVKQLNSNHRLILSGTPIQNNVLELWSLFDFLMPGFLGTEKQFQARYGRPILLSRDAKSSSKEQEAGALAMEALHRQVLPFLLRRLKEDVLKDLPPKIIQDYYCDLSPLQVQLYEDFAKSRASQNINETVHDFEEEKAKVNTGNTTHVFQALQYLRKVCNHPALALTPSHPQYDLISSQLKQQNSGLRDLQHAPKLTALRQLLQDCGIGVVAGDDTPVVNQHRVLMFCQLKSMLDIVENDLFKKEMKGVTYLRLDGSVPAGSRIGIVNRFNNDPSIDVLLLTTHVGGLGLNLTGADTVVFVEHDWNPMKDLQAMDRAHRIGQKKVVNVYRLITRGTLEEKIMGLQKFKMNIANTIISQDNSSLASMATDQLLDLFSLDEAQKSKSVAQRTGTEEESSKKQSIKSVLENMEELWDTEQYESEYNLDGFMKSLSKT